MAYPTILTQSQVAAHITNTLTNINNGLHAYNNLAGQAIQMPDEVQFSCIIIDQFQALPVVTNEGGTNTDLQTGTDTAVTTGTTTDAPPSGGFSQVTTHGETVDVTDTENETYTGYDPSAVLATGSADSPNVTGP